MIRKLMKEEYKNAINLSYQVCIECGINDLVVFHRVCLRPVCLRSDDAKLIDNFVFHIKKANFML